MACAGCGRPRVQATNTPQTAVLVGDADGFARRVRVGGPWMSWQPGDVLYVTGDGVDALLADGVLAFA